MKVPHPLQTATGLGEGLIMRATIAVTKVRLTTVRRVVEGGSLPLTAFWKQFCERWRVQIWRSSAECGVHFDLAHGWGAWCPAGHASHGQFNASESLTA